MAIILDFFHNFKDNVHNLLQQHEGLKFEIFHMFVNMLYRHATLLFFNALMSACIDVWHASTSIQSIYFRLKPIQGQKVPRCWNIDVRQTMFGKEISSNIFSLLIPRYIYYGISKKVSIKTVPINNLRV